LARAKSWTHRDNQQIYITGLFCSSNPTILLFGSPQPELPALNSPFPSPTDGQIFENDVISDEAVEASI